MDEDIEAAVLGIVRDVLGRPGIGPEDDAFECGATSLSFVHILASINATFGVRVNPPDLDGVVTASNLAAHVLAAPTRSTAEKLGA